MDVKSCITEKDIIFTYFTSKMLYISVSKSVHICTFVIVTVHICTATVDHVSNILDLFLSPSPHSLSFSLSPFCLSPFQSTDLTSVHLTLIFSLSPFWVSLFQSTPHRSSNHTTLIIKRSSLSLSLSLSLKIGFGGVGMWVVLGLWGRR